MSVHCYGKIEASCALLVVAVNTLYCISYCILYTLYCKLAQCVYKLLIYLFLLSTLYLQFCTTAIVSMLFRRQYRVISCKIFSPSDCMRCSRNHRVSKCTTEASQRCRLELYRPEWPIFGISFYILCYSSFESFLCMSVSVELGLVSAVPW